MTLGTLIWIVPLGIFLIIGNYRLIKFLVKTPSDDMDAVHILTLAMDIIVIMVGLVFLTIWANTIKLW